MNDDEIIAKYQERFSICSIEGRQPDIYAHIEAWKQITDMLQESGLNRSEAVYKIHKLKHKLREGLV